VAPFIGITGSYNYKKNYAFLKDEYYTAIEKAGGIPLVLLPLEDHASIIHYVEKLDGIILAGGPDIDPAHFGEFPKPYLRRICPKRDTFEIGLTKKCIEHEKPILGICRGMQVINIALGGDVFQDMHTEVKGAFKHVQDAPRWYASHEIEITDLNSRLYSIVGIKKMKVNSFHHQSLKRVAPSLAVTAVSADGIIEAVESIKKNVYCMGVQWHPEFMWEKDPFQFSIFKSFIDFINGEEEA
jgi:putative glutamine amidotransferase